MAERFGKYEFFLDRQLGNTNVPSSEGKVYEGRDTETNTEVAVKIVIRRDLTWKHFRKELRLLERLEKMAEANPNNFEHLVKIHEYRASSTPLRFVAASFFVDPTVEFKYAMEYCNGGDLRQYVPLNGIAVSVIQDLSRQIASALKTLRDNRIVHRDLKPENIVLHRANERLILKLTDYGHSRVLDRNGLASSCVGTKMYRAPEVWDHPVNSRRRNLHLEFSVCMQRYVYDAKVDLFSVGLILYECYTGAHPFLLPAGSVDKLRRFYKDHAQGALDTYVRNGLGHGCPAELRELILGLLVKDPNDRMDFDHFLVNPFFASHYEGPQSSES